MHYYFKIIVVSVVWMDLHNAGLYGLTGNGEDDQETNLSK